MKQLSDILGGVICLAIFIPFLYLLVQWSKKQSEKAKAEMEERLRIFEAAKNKYQNALDSLKNDPVNPDIKQKTLQSGRDFAEITRQFQGTNGVTLFDEVALMNDINAACAGATVSTSKVAVADTVEARLAKLFELKVKSLITEEEHKIRRQKILDEI
jgi:hypothetical protein